MYKTGLAFIEATTGNGKEKYSYWDHHYIKGIYKVVEIDEEHQRLWCQEEKIRFPLCFDRIKKFEPQA